MSEQIIDVIKSGVIGSIVFLFVTPYIHEYGHYYSAKLLGLRTKLMMKKFQVCTEYDNELQHSIVIISGIFVGLIPLLFLPDGEKSIFFKVYFIIIYLFYSCSSDDIKLIRIFCNYFKIYFPDILDNIENYLISEKHHKYCECDYCIKKKSDNMFNFRS